MSTSTASAPLLMDPSVFGQSGGAVELIQTHIGWIYLVGPYAFKLKKQVKFDFLDFTTLEQRHAVCRREIDLNRRLCPDLYLGLVPVVEESDGRRRVILQPRPDDESRAVDWAVWMRRLPSDRMLDRLLVEGRVTPADTERIADTLGDFYNRHRGEVAPGGLGDLACLTGNVEENIREGRAIDRAILSDGAAQLIERRARYFLEKHSAIVEQRARDGFIVDGHGDLRSENIWLPESGPPLPFDCIEFNDRFRVCDSALDAAFLAMDLDSRGREDLSRAFLDRYRKRCDPNLPPRLLNFYLGYRAFVKAKVAAWISMDERVGAAQRASSRAQAAGLFDLAVRYALKNQPALLVFCGVAGSGKSTLARHIASRLKCEHLATDIVRDEIVPRSLPKEERYKSEVSYRVYQVVLQRAACELQMNRVVVVDGTFTAPGIRKQAAEMSRAGGAPSILVWADCPAEKLAANIAAREAAGQLHGSEATAEISAKQLAAFEKPKEKEGFSAICRVDTGVAVDASQREAWDRCMASL